MRALRRPMIRAVAGTRACVILQRHLGAQQLDQLARLAAGLERGGDPESRAGGAELRLFLDELCEAARQWKARDVEIDSDGSGSVSGTSEPPDPADLSASEGTPGSTPQVGVLLSVAEVADKFGLSRSYITRCCRSKDGRGLSATKVGREWVIDPGSLVEFEARRKGLECSA